MNVKYLFSVVCFCFCIINSHAQESLTSYRRLQEINLRGKIDSKYSILMNLMIDYRLSYIDWASSGNDKLTGYVTKAEVFGNYYYQSKNTNIFLKGQIQRFENDEKLGNIDSLKLEEFNALNEHTGTFIIRLKEGIGSGFWVNVKTKVKYPIFLEESKSHFAETIKVRLNECSCFIDLDNASSSSIIFNKDVKGKTYILTDSQKPHCGFYKSFGTCCGGDDKDFNLFMIDSGCKPKLISSEIYVDCNNPDIFKENIKLKEQAKDFTFGRIQRLDLGTTEAGKLFINVNEMEKGIQIDLIKK